MLDLCSGTRTQDSLQRRVCRKICTVRQPLVLGSWERLALAAMYKLEHGKQLVVLDTSALVGFVTRHFLIR